MSGQILVNLSCPSIDPTLDGFSSHFVFQTAGLVSGANMSSIVSHCTAFYNSVPAGGTAPVATYLSSTLNSGTNAAMAEVYNITGHLDGSPHGSPIAVLSWTLGGSGGGSNVPEGVAGSVTYRADYGSDVEFAPGARPRARDRNRTYIGPLTIDALTQDSVTHRVKLATAFISNVLKSMFNLSSSVSDGAGNTFVLQVWSRKNASVKLPIEAYLDDRPDYQRRRTDDNPATRTHLPLSSA